MVALGPRVGGAHVDVNLKMNDKSIDTVGRRITRQLSRVADQNRSTFRAIGRDAVTAWRGMLGTLVSSAPILGPAISAITGQLTLLAGAMHSTVQSGLALAPILTSLGLAMTTFKLGFGGVGKAINEFDPKRLKVELAALSPPARAFAIVMRGLKKELTSKVGTHIFAGLLGEIKKLDSGFIPTITKGFLKMADALNGLFKQVLHYVNTAAGLKVINKFFSGNVEIFKHLSKVVVPFLDGFLRLINALTPSAIRLSDNIAKLARRFDNWTKSAGFAERIDAMMKRASHTAGLLFKVFSNLGQALNNLFNTTNPQSNSLLQIFVDLTDRFKKFTASAKGQQSIQKWAKQSIDVMIAFGHVIEAVFKVLHGLSDSRFLVQFLQTVADAFNILAKLPLAAFISKLTDLHIALDPIAGPILAAIIASAALNIVFGNLIGQVAGFAAVLFKLGKFLGKGIFKGGGFLKGLTGTGKHVKEIGTLSTSFGRFGRLLSVGLKFAGFAGLAIWIATIILKSKDLRKKFGDALKAVGQAFSSLSGALKQIITALEPVFKLLAKLEPVFAFLVGVILDTVIFAFKSLARTLDGAGKIIAGIINILVGLFTLDFGKVGKGLKQVFSGIGPLLLGVGGLILTFFAPARLAKIAFLGFRGLLGGLLRSSPTILAFLARFLFRILAFFIKLPFKLLGLGNKSIAALGGAIVRGAPKVLGAAGRIVSGILGFIGRLPGRLLSLGGRAIGNLAGAFGRGVGRLGGIAGRIFNAIWNKIKGLPGKMLGLGKSIITSLIKGILSGIGKLGSALGSVASKIGSFLPGSPVKEGPLTAWNYGGDASGGGRNVIDALVAGLRDTSGITRAMSDVAGMVASASRPAAVGVGAGAINREMHVTVHNPVPETASDSLLRASRNLAYLGLTP